MTKSELIEMLKDVGDDDQIFVVSCEYDPEDDSTWMAETQSDVSHVMKDGSDVYLVLDCGSFA